MIYKIISTFLGIGYIGRGSGTVASVLVCILLYVAVSVQIFSTYGLILCIIILFGIGILAAGKVEIDWGKDSKRVVIDEVVGMMITLSFSPINFISLIIGFVLFRFFDIYKPLYIKQTEQLPGGWGVMTDDLLAGIYANILLQVALYFIS